MTSVPFESYAQNGEDVVLWRALQDVPPGTGRYVDVGANDPVVASVTWALYERGWRGITAEPVPAYAAAHRERRPGDVQVEAVIGALDADEVVLHQIDDTGLSTIEAGIAEGHASSGWSVVDRTVPVRRLDDVLAEAGWDEGDLHLLKVDTEGSELAVLQSIDLRRSRPWVVVVEATAPLSTTPTHDSWEHVVLSAGYTFCLFDGLSRFYVADEHAERLAGRLSYPACALDDFSTMQTRSLRRQRERALAEVETVTAERDQARAELAAASAELADLQGRLADSAHRVAELTRDAVRWRTAALTRWGHALTGASAGSVNSEVGLLRNEVEAMRRTVSWRVTRPLRTVRTRAGVLRSRL